MAEVVLVLAAEGTNRAFTVAVGNRQPNMREEQVGPLGAGGELRSNVVDGGDPILEGFVLARASDVELGQTASFFRMTEP